MASSSRLFFLAFIVLVLTTSKTEAQQGGLGGLGGLLGSGLGGLIGGLGGLLGGLLGLPGGILSSINIRGTVFCSVDGNMGINGTATPVFPNALVQLQCGAPGNVVSTTTTNSVGIFSMVLEPIPFLLSSLPTNCTIVVNTPLSKCNVNLPSAGILQSPLQFVGINTINGIANIIASGFFHILN